MADRPLPHVRVRRLSTNKSSRNGAAPKLIVVHSTEGTNQQGLADLVALGSFFANPAAQVSSHVATDDEGNSARFVRDQDKAFHCKAFNSVSLGIEQVGRAAQASWTEAQQRESARWLAYWSRKHGIPLQKGKVVNGSVVRPGVIRHSELGAPGGAHSDPGRNYPLADVIQLARHYRRMQGG